MSMTIEELQKSTSNLSKEMQAELEKLAKEMEKERERLSKEMEDNGALNLNMKNTNLMREMLIIRPGIWNKFSPECKKELLKNRTLLTTYIASFAFDEKEFENSAPKKMDENVENLYRLRKIGPYTSEGEAQMFTNLDFADFDIYKACEAMLRTCMFEEMHSRIESGEDYKALMHYLPMEYSRKCSDIYEARRYALPGDKHSENSEPEIV